MPIPVPAVAGQTQAAAETALSAAGLAAGTISQANSPTVPAGAVISSDPSAGTMVDVGAKVNLVISIGPMPPAKLAVPDVIGFTRQAAQAVLKERGLVVGDVDTVASDTVAKGGITGTDPVAGELIDPNSKVALHVSSGPKTNFAQYIPNILFVILGLIVLFVIVYPLLSPNATFLTRLGTKEVARGLITFLIALSTVGIAIILAVSTLVLPSGDDGDKRFDHGKQVLSVLIGVLGTIVGFYFGSAPESRVPLTIATQALKAATVNQAYEVQLEATGGTQPLNWTVTPALPQGLALNGSSGVISGTPAAILQPTKFTFTATDSASPPAAASAVLTLEIKAQ